jgi:hypothetical protein
MNQKHNWSLSNAVDRKRLAFAFGVKDRELQHRLEIAAEEYGDGEHWYTEQELVTLALRKFTPQQQDALCCGQELAPHFTGEVHSETRSREREEQLRAIKVQATEYANRVIRERELLEYTTFHKNRAVARQAALKELKELEIRTEPSVYQQASHQLWDQTVSAVVKRLHTTLVLAEHVPNWKPDTGLSSLGHIAHA